MFRAFIALAIALSLTSCNSMYYSFHREPFPAYARSVETSQTAVLSVMVEGTVPVNGIESVDGAESPCVKAGCPMWVRVASGSHKFLVKHTQWNGNWHRDVRMEVVVEDMLPKHVYLVKIHGKDDRLTHETIDLGESPDYGVSLGKGKDRLYHRVMF